MEAVNVRFPPLTAVQEVCFRAVGQTSGFGLGADVVVRPIADLSPWPSALATDETRLPNYGSAF